LFIDNEFELVDIVKRCLSYHSEKGEKVPVLPEEVAGPEVWHRLTEVEKKARKDLYDKELKAIKDSEVAQKKEDIAIFHKFGKKQDEDKASFILEVT